MAKGSGNLIRKFDKIDYDPFSEEFDSDEIVNRGEGVDALSTPEQEEKIEKKQVKPEQVFSDEDLAEMAKKGEEGEDAVELYKKLADEEEDESSIIKEDEIHEHRIDSLYSEEFSPEPPDKEELNEILERDDEKKEESSKSEEEDDEYLYFRDKTGRKVKRSKEFLKKQKDYEEKLIASLYGPDYSETDEFRDMILLKNKFNEIFKADKLKPAANRSSERNLMPSDEISKDKKFIEVTEAPSFKDGEPHGASTVEINRNESGEIESIVVLCKCGEETVIEFDYTDEEEDELTVIDNEEYSEEDDLKSEEEADESSDDSLEETENQEPENEVKHDGVNEEETKEENVAEGNINEAGSVDTEQDEENEADEETDEKFEDMFPDENEDKSEE